MKTQVFNSCPQGQFMRPTGAIRFLSTVFAKCGISYPPQNRKGKSRANKNTEIMIKSKKGANKGLKTGRNVKTLKKCVQTLFFFFHLCKILGCLGMRFWNLGYSRIDIVCFLWMSYRMFLLFQLSLFFLIFPCLALLNS